MSDFDFWNEGEEPLAPQDSEQSGRKKSKKKDKKGRAIKKEKSLKKAKAQAATPVVSDEQSSLLGDFWDLLEPQSQTIENLQSEEELIDSFFQESIETKTRFVRDQDEPLTRKLQVGLYASDVDLLEELYRQSKRAGLPNVSRARILRVALRHFHTCWLQQDRS